MELRQLRDKASEAFTKGRFSKAAELYEQYTKGDPKDYQARVRLGDAWVKAGQRDRAIQAYQAAAEGFAREGFLPRAIAASKLILELDPKHQGVQQMLADLYARRGGPAAAEGRSSRAPAPAAPQAPQAPAPPAAPAPAAAPPPPEPPRAPAPLSALKADARPLDRSSELPPELALPETPPAAAPAAPPEQAPEEVAGIEVEVDLSGAEGSSGGVEVELDLSGAEAPATPVAALSMPRTSAAPPGLKPKRAAAPSAPPPPAQVPAAPPALPVAGPSSALADSLLHAVEQAARSAAEGEEILVGEELSPEPQHPLGALPKIPLFSDLPVEAFIALFESCPLLRFPQGATIIQQGVRGDSFFVICEGRVRVVREEHGHPRDLAVLETGAFFGEMALLSGGPRAASVLSDSEDTQVLEISAHLLADLSRRYPQVAQALRKFCRERLLSNVMVTSALFEPFDRKDRRELLARFLSREVQGGEVILREGDRVDGLYVVLSGEVEVRKAGHQLALLREGELFGEISLLRRTAASATVTSTRRTSLLRLPREDFDTLILTHPQILALVSDLSEDRLKRTQVLLGSAQAGESHVMV